MKTKLMLAVSALALGFASNAFGQDAMDMKSSIAAAPAETTKTVPAATITPDGKLAIQASAAAPTPKVEADPATTGSTVPAPKVAEAAKPDLCGAAKQNFADVKKSGDGKAFNRAAEAMNAACGTGKKPNPAPKAKAANDTKSAKPKVTAQAAPKAKPAKAVVSLQQAELNPTYVSGKIDPLTGKPLVERFDTLRFGVFGDVGLGNTSADGFKSKKTMIGRVGAQVGYEFVPNIEAFAGVYIGGGNGKLSHTESSTVLQPQGRLLPPLRRALTTTDELSRGATYGARAGLGYRFDQTFSAGGYALVEMSRYSFKSNTTLGGVGPIPSVMLGQFSASSMVTRFGVGAYVSAKVPDTNVNLTLSAEHLFGASPKFKGAKVDIDGETRVMLGARYDFMTW